MSSISINPVVQDRIRPGYDCRNGQLVSAWLQQTLAERANQLVHHRVKELFSSTGPVESTILFNGKWRFASHTSPLCYAIVARVLVQQTAMDAVDSLCGVTMTIANSSGTTLASSAAYGGNAYGQTLGQVPDEWVMLTMGVSATAFQDTDIRVTIADAQYTRLVSCVVYEVPMPPDTDNGYVQQSFSVGNHIRSDHRSGVQDLVVDHYNRGAAPLFNYSSRHDDTAPTNLDLTYKNLFDDSAVTAMTSGSPGFLIDLRYCNRKMATTVPCRFEVYAAMDNGTTGSVRLYNASGTVVKTHDITGSAAWYQTTVDLPPTQALYYLYHIGTGSLGGGGGGGTVTTYAASLYQYA